MQHGDIQDAGFRTFSERGGAYYTRFLKQCLGEGLPFWHINPAAVLGGFLWAAVRSNRMLFWLGFCLDLLAAANAALVFRYANQIETAMAEGKGYLVERYQGWSDSALVAGILFLLLGRLLIGWLADRQYARQYERWQADPHNPSGFQLRRLWLAAVAVLLVWPLTIYGASQTPPEARECVAQQRSLHAGGTAPLKAQLDCLLIGEFPALIWMDRPDEVRYPRDADGNRFIEVTPANPDMPPVDLATYLSQKMENAVGYLTAFYGFFFDSFTILLRRLLGAITAVFVGTPWPVTAGALLAIAYSLAGTRTAIFVAASLSYIALMGFWTVAMDTMSLVVASTLICILIGLPLGIWLAKSDRARAVTTPVLDIMQTIPSFVYLLPAVAFFSIGKPPAILATVIFAMPPMARLTALGIQQVPETTREAALAFGASPRQLLLKVELPLALPSIMAGVNQVVMMSLSMVVIAALIGAGGLGFIVTEALANTRIGRGVLAGLAIALIAMMIDRVVQGCGRAKARRKRPAKQ